MIIGCLLFCIIIVYCRGPGRPGIFQRRLGIKNSLKPTINKAMDMVINIYTGIIHYTTVNTL
jgi:hypothetical protein